MNQNHQFVKLGGQNVTIKNLGDQNCNLAYWLLM